MSNITAKTTRSCNFGIATADELGVPGLDELGVSGLDELGLDELGVTRLAIIMMSAPTMFSAVLVRSTAPRLIISPVEPSNSPEAAKMPCPGIGSSGIKTPVNAVKDVTTVRECAWVENTL